MSDLIAGRYPLFEEEWALDGSPLPPYRHSMSRKDILVTGVTLTQAKVWVFPVVCHPGDVIGAVSIGVKTATGTPTHGWAALYTGVGTGATLITQSADNVLGFTPTAGSQKLTLATPVLVGGSPAGVAQGAPATAAPSTSGAPVILGVALYNSGAADGVLDGMTGSSVAGAVIITGQPPLASNFNLAATATAPATLAGAAAVVSGIPYIVLSRS